MGRTFDRSYTLRKRTQELTPIHKSEIKSVIVVDGWEVLCLRFQSVSWAHPATRGPGGGTPILTFFIRKNVTHEQKWKNVTIDSIFLKKKLVIRSKWSFFTFWT